MPYPFLVCGNLLLEWCHKSDSQEITHCKSCEADVLGRLLSLLRWCQGSPGVFLHAKLAVAWRICCKSAAKNRAALQVWEDRLVYPE